MMITLAAKDNNQYRKEINLWWESIIKEQKYMFCLTMIYQEVDEKFDSPVKRCKNKKKKATEKKPIRYQQKVKVQDGKLIFKFRR